MGFTKEKMDEINRDFVEEYMKKTPYSEYIAGVGISELRKKQDDIHLIEGESLEDFCLSVYLKKEPSEGLLPSNYKGVRVLYEIAGWASALGR